MINIPLLKASDIEVKVKQITEKGAIALLYKTARVDMEILDEVYGPLNWTSDYKEIKGNLYCGIGVRENPGDTFVWKWDCGIESREDDEGNQKKGEASDAFKRAGFKQGIGRELYTAPFIFLNVETKLDKQVGGKNYYKLANPYARFTCAEIDYVDGKISTLVIVDDNGEQVYPKKQYTRVKQKTKRDIELEEVLKVVDITMREVIDFCDKKYNEKDINKLSTEQFIELITRIESKKKDA